MNTHGGILNRLFQMRCSTPFTSTPQRRHDSRAAEDTRSRLRRLGVGALPGAPLDVRRPPRRRPPYWVSRAGIPSYLAAIIARRAGHHRALRSVDARRLPPARPRSPDGRAGDRRCSAAARAALGLLPAARRLPPATSARSGTATALFPGIELHNLYGPTEAAVDVTWWPCRPGAPTVPIGWPVHNTHLYVLDGHLHPVPAGVRGELYIGGAQRGARPISVGPDLTAARFVPDPFGATSGARMYVTGDVARILHSGEIEYLGRTDLQVKIRGHRIELGEIEAALGQHAGVREVVVIAREDTPGDKRLVAYVVAKDPEAPALPVAELRAFAKERLPEHMLPAAFVALAGFPAAHLRRPARIAARSRHPRRARWRVAIASSPRGPVEEAIAGVFAAVLGVPPERVGAHDGFFELGGHSLLATMVVVRLRAALGVELPLRALFEAPTPAGLALHARPLRRPRRRRRERRGRPSAGPRRASRPCSRSRRSASGSSISSRRAIPSYVVPLALRLAGALDGGALEQALREIVRRHEVLRTSLCRARRRPLARAPRHPSCRCSRSPPARRSPRRSARPWCGARPRWRRSRPFDLAADIPIRARLLDLGEGGSPLARLSHAPRRLRRLEPGRLRPRAGRAPQAHSRAACLPRCRSSPSSTPTTRPGSARGSPARPWAGSSPTGSNTSPARRAPSTCPPIAPALPSSDTAAPSAASP